MRFQIFVCGTAVIAMGLAAMNVMGRTAAAGFLNGALTLGGGLLICGLFSLKMKWHGIIGAGVLALLASARGLGNFPDLALYLSGERERGPAPLLEFGVTMLCLVLLMQVIVSLYRERIQRMLDK